MKLVSSSTWQLRLLNSWAGIGEAWLGLTVMVEKHEMQLVKMAFLKGWEQAHQNLFTCSPDYVEIQISR